MAIVLSIILLSTDSDYPFGILWPLCCLSFYYLRILITPLVSYGILWLLCCLSFYYLQILITLLVSCGHCVVYHSTIYGFRLPLWYLMAIVLSIILLSTDSDYPFGILWPLCCLSFYYLRILITPLVSYGYCVVCHSTIYKF